MNASVKKGLSHLACAAIGIFAAAALGHAVKTGADAGHQTAASRGETSGGSGRDEPAGSKVANVSRIATLKSKDFRNAWDAIARRDLTPRERCQMQKKVLEQWAKVDLKAAMAAALENPWDGGFEEGGIDSLVPAFSEAFMKNPLEAWEIIQSGQLGLGAALFRWQWVDSVSKGNPLLVLSYFNEFSPGLRRAALNPILRKHPGDPEVATAIRKMLDGLPADESSKNLSYEYFKLAPPAESPAELGAKVAAAATEQERNIALQALIASLRNADMDTVKGEWSKLPAAARDDLTQALLTSSQGKLPPTALLDLAMQTGNWALFTDPRIAGAQGVMANYARTAEPIKLAEWGLNLPERPETLDVYRRSVSGYIGQNYIEARDWILTIPEGDWRRERALAEYSQNALWAKNDPAGSQWAIDQIKDPRMKGTVINWRKEWTERTGRK